MRTPTDTPDSAAAHPALTPAAAKQFETALFGGDESREWPAMQSAGRAIAGAVLRDCRELGEFPAGARILVLAGKGHNGGDALLAAKYILEKHPRATATVCLAFGERALRPLALRAYRELAHAAPGSAGILPASTSGIIAAATSAACENPAAFDLCLDGLFGFQFRPPVDPRIAALIAAVNALPIRFRAAIDLPSGLGDSNPAHILRADFTYATGIVKNPVLDDNARAHTGRLRYLDLGFFGSSGTGCQPVGMKNSPLRKRTEKTQTDEPYHVHARILTPAILAPLRALRPTVCDKRDFGHLFILGGSRAYPGAVMLSVLAALRSGAGLVTAFVPKSLAPAFAAQVPEAIWRCMDESPAGGLSLENFGMLRERFEDTNPGTGRPTALLIGPGLSRDREALILMTIIMNMAGDIPTVIDADALQPEIVSAGAAPRILTPHAGEHARIASAIPPGAVTVRKGPLTRIELSDTKYFSPFGGPVLARGGSGDVLAGLIGGLLAQTPSAPLLAACRGAAWHGMAADCLARARGQRAVSAGQLIDFLPEVFRSADCQVCCLESHSAAGDVSKQQTWQSAPQ